jgi:hypothetical protein
MSNLFNPPCIILVNLYDMSHDQNCMFTRIAEHHQRQSPKVRCGRDRMDYLSFVLCNLCLPPLMLWVRIALNARCTTLCDKVCQWLAAGRWFPPGTPVSSTNKTGPPWYHWNIAQYYTRVIPMPYYSSSRYGLILAICITYSKS